MPVPMHALNAVDLSFAAFFGGVGVLCFWRALSVWRTRNGGSFTRAFCGVLAGEGIAGVISFGYLSYLWNVGVPVPSLSYYPYLTEKLLQSIGWLFVLVFVIPRIVEK